MDAGVVVYANDHCGHGFTAPSADHYGNFGALGFTGLVSDMARLSERARTENPDVPIVLMGHSMGSFAAQLYALLHSEDIDGLVISGSAALDQVVTVLPADPDAPALDAFNGAFDRTCGPSDRHAVL